MMFGLDGATAIAPIDPVDCSSKIGTQFDAVVGRSPHAAVVEPDVEHVRLAGHARERAGAAGAVGPMWRQRISWNERS